MTPQPDGQDQRGRRTWWRLSLLLLAYGGLFLLGHWGGDQLARSMGLTPGQAPTGAGNRILWTALLAYVVLLAIPFVPGMEVSIALFATFGGAIALHVYLATLLALVIAFLAGRLVPPQAIAAVFQAIGLESAERLVRRLAPLRPEERMASLIEQAPSRFAPTLLRYRYLAVILVLNVPGNAVIGGGGGIALLAGMSGLFSFPLYLAAIALAVLPVPLATVLAGRWLW